jgi:kynurenine formamidase
VHFAVQGIIAIDGDQATATAAGDARQVRWQPAEVTSRRLDHPVPVTAARDIPYISHANRLQNLSIYLPRTPETTGLAGAPVTSLPGADVPSRLPRYLVHVHGGAWRDPRLTSASIEPAVACAFSGEGPAPIAAIAALNYTVSSFGYPPAVYGESPPSPTTL